MNTMKRSFTAMLAVVTLGAGSLSGCAGMTNKEKGAVVGASTGAALGGIIGRRTCSTARGAILGAVVGGAAGAVIGRRMDQQAEQLDQDLEGASVERIGEGIAVTFESGILFPYNSTEVLPAGRDNLRRLAASLQRYPETEVLIVGHTDATGSDTYNQDLSERRAAAARSFLTAQGIAGNRIRTSGRGESEPIAPNTTDAGRQQNRRVEIAIFASPEYRERILRESRGE